MAPFTFHGSRLWIRPANRPLEKMGEIRIINLAGLNDNSGLDNALSGILASTSIVPIIKEG